MNKKYIIMMAVTLSASLYQTIFAQQTPVFSNYSDNRILINPAYAGFEPEIDITFTSTGQLSGVEGSPRTLGLIVNAPLDSEKVGLGGGVYNDQVGITKTTRLFGAYSYKLFFNSDRNTWWSYNPHVLSFGISAGAMFYNENLLDLDIPDDPNFANNISTTVPILGLGVLYNRDHIFVGLSADNLLGDSLSSEENIDINATYYIHGGYRFFATRFQEVLITPSVLLKYASGAPAQADFNIKVNHKNKFEAGAGYRTNSSINLLGGFYLSNIFKVLLSYNIALNNSVVINDAFGIVLSWRLGDGF